MQRLLSALFLASTLLLADAPSVSGVWKVNTSVSGNESESECTFKQQEKELTGSCKTSRGEVAVSGQVDDKNIKWTFKTDYQGDPLTVTYTGKLDASGKLTGQVQVEPIGYSGDFSATPIK